MAPAPKSSRKAPSSVNPRAALPENIQGLVDRLAQNRIRELVHRGVLSVNADYTKAIRVVSAPPQQQTFIPR